MNRKTRRPVRDESQPGVRARRSEQLLIDTLDQFPCRGAMACTSLGRGQLAAALRQQAAAQSSADTEVPDVVCLQLDQFDADRSLQFLSETGQGGVEVLCQPDFPESAFELIAIPTAARGQTELTRDLLQSAHQRLAAGGRLLVATDNPRDQWLHQQLQSMFKKVTRIPSEWGVVYAARRTEPLRKVKNFECRFTLKSGERVLTIVSRPGVFSHRRVDDGARAVLKIVELQPGMRILDLGCGSGCLALALAALGEDVTVTAVDSHSRAIQCTKLGAELNGLADRVSCQLDASGHSIGAGEFDLVVTNPPYYSHYQIAERFVASAADALRPGGQLVLVTKQPSWFLENLPAVFGDLEDHSVGHYHVITARRFSR